MATPTDIVNIALRRVGADRISNLTQDATKEARIGRDLYDEARRDLLSLHAWNFSIKRAQLTASLTPPTFGWDYAYALPEDFIRVVSAHPHDDDESTVPYRLEFQASDDRVLLTNSNQLYLRYVFDLEDVNVFSASFRDVLSWRLARDFAAGLSKSTSAAELADGQYRRTLARAKSIDGIEDFPERMADGSWLDARFADTSRS